MFDKSTLTGSIEFVGYEERGKEYVKYNFQCMAVDIPNLPTENIPSGSSCWILDGQGVVVFSAKQKAWF